MSIIVHVNKFVLARNREHGENNPPYCVHGPAANDYPFVGRYFELRGKGEFFFTPGILIPVPEPDTEAGATHVMALDDENCELWGDTGKAWVRIDRGTILASMAGVRPHLQLVEQRRFVMHDEHHVHSISMPRVRHNPNQGPQQTFESDHKHEHSHEYGKSVNGHNGEDHFDGQSQDVARAAHSEGWWRE